MSERADSDGERCARELIALGQMQRDRSFGLDPRAWLIPAELHDLYINNALVRQVFDVIMTRELTQSFRLDFSREPALIQLVLALVADRQELLKNFEQHLQNQSITILKVPR